MNLNTLAAFPAGGWAPIANTYLHDPVSVLNSRGVYRRGPPSMAAPTHS